MELRLIQRFGYVLITTTDGRTAVAQPPHITETAMNFTIVAWCDTYEEALTLVQVADFNAETDDVAPALTN